MKIAFLKVYHDRTIQDMDRRSCDSHLYDLICESGYSALAIMMFTTTKFGQLPEFSPWASIAMNYQAVNDWVEEWKVQQREGTIEEKNDDVLITDVQPAPQTLSLPTRTTETNPLQDAQRRITELEGEYKELQLVHRKLKSNYAFLESNHKQLREEMKPLEAENQRLWEICYGTESQLEYHGSGIRKTKRRPDRRLQIDETGCSFFEARARTPPRSAKEDLCDVWDDGKEIVDLLS